MRRLATVLAASALVGWGVLGGLEACGGDTEPVAPADDAGDDGSSGGTNGTSGGSSGSDASSSSGGDTATPNPGRVTCGSTECDAGGMRGNTRVCCVRNGDPTCSTLDDCEEDDDVTLACDEPADCTMGRACCLRGGGGGGGRDGGGGGRGELRAECGGPGGACGRDGVRLCKTAADCGDAGACNAKTCRGLRVHVCGDPEICD